MIRLQAYSMMGENVLSSSDYIFIVSFLQLTRISRPDNLIKERMTVPFSKLHSNDH